MFRLFLFVVLLLPVSLSGQSFEIYGGFNRNHFNTRRYIAPEPVLKHANQLEARDGFAIGLAVYDLKVVNNWKPWFALQFEQYSGWFDLRGSEGQTLNFVKGEITRSVLQMSLYPLDITYWKVLRTSVGLQLGTRLNEQVNGLRGVLGSGIDIEESFSQNTPKGLEWYGGLVARMALEIKCHENWWIVPQYTAYIGLSNELAAYPYDTPIRAFRQLGAIGIKKRFD
ncbi:MAG: hypothetical protein ACFB10_23145 [Salibacteraceae bacterium]